MADSSVRAEFGALRSQQLPRVRLRHESIFSSFGACAAALEITEAATVIMTALAAKYLYFDLFSHQVQPFLPYVALGPLLGITLYLFMKQAGLYEAPALDQPIVAYGRIFGALASSFLIVLGLLYVLKFADWYSRGWFLTWFALSTIALITVRIVSVRLVKRMIADRTLRHRIALFGTDEFIVRMKAQIESGADSGAVEGFFLEGPSGLSPNDFSFDGGVQDLKRALENKRYDTVIIGFPAEKTARIKAAINDLASYSTELLLCTNLDRGPLVFRGARDIGHLRADIVNLVPLSEINRLLKFAVDSVLASLGLLLLSPLLLAIAVAIKLDSPGPVFFRQRRYGQNNRIFRIYKFRTMFVAEDGRDVKQAQWNDPRVTRLGWFLRRTSLDELPQLINVLTGDMSIVGPRPHALVHDEQFERQFDHFALRRRVRPGLTGWAQVNGMRGETKTADDIRQRLDYDLFYIEKWSFWFDIEIMVRTIFVLFRGRAY